MTGGQRLGIKRENLRANAEEYPRFSKSEQGKTFLYMGAESRVR